MLLQKPSAIVFSRLMPSVVLKEQSNSQSVLYCNYQDPAQLLQGVTYKAKYLLISCFKSFIKHENTSVNIGYIVNIRSFQISHWVSEGSASLPDTADYQNQIVLFTST